MSQTANFDRVARIYRWAEYLALGPLLERMRNHFLPQLTSRRQALVLGDGDGRFTAALLRTHAQIDVLAVDISATMLHLLRRRCSAQGDRLTTLQASALDVTPPPNTDLVVTHFFLDCLTQPQLDLLVARIAAATDPGTLWLLSDFRTPAHGLARPFAAAYIGVLYAAFGVLTGLRVNCLPDPQTAFRAAGLKPLAQHSSLFGMLYTELWQHGGTASVPATISAVDVATQLHDHPHHLLEKTMNSPTIDATPDRPAPHNAGDALPDPEPAAPSLAEPDPGVFHHEPGTLPAQKSQQ